MSSSNVHKAEYRLNGIVRNSIVEAEKISTLELQDCLCQKDVNKLCDTSDKITVTKNRAGKHSAHRARLYKKFGIRKKTR